MKPVSCYTHIVIGEVNEGGEQPQPKSRGLAAETCILQVVRVFSQPRLRVRADIIGHARINM